MHIIAFLSYRLAHIFTPGYGPFSVFMHCLGVSWALDLGAHSSHYFFLSWHHYISLHLIGYVIYLIFSILSAVCFAPFFFILSGDPPQFITWRVVISFSLSIPRTLIQKSLVWEGHLVRESFCFLSTWDGVYPLFTSSLGFICLCSGYVHLYICKKKNEKKIKEK